MLRFPTVGTLQQTVLPGVGHVSQSLPLSLSIPATVSLVSQTFLCGCTQIDKQIRIFK